MSATQRNATQRRDYAVTFRLIGATLTALLSLNGIRQGGDDHRDAAWVDQRVEASQPSPDERRIDRIGWARDIRSALQLGRDHRRPVFLFTMDGRFSTGRC
jgi:hypothetical protein